VASEPSVQVEATYSGKGFLSCGIVCKQILINAKLHIGKRGQNSELHWTVEVGGGGVGGGGEEEGEEEEEYKK